jgi:hypothetical protein
MDLKKIPADSQIRQRKPVPVDSDIPHANLQESPLPFPLPEDIDQGIS